MESQITLVNGYPAHEETAFVLYFDTDSVNNTTLTPRNNSFVSYSISSNANATSTTIQRIRTYDSPAPTFVGTIERHSFLPDKITFDRGAPIKVSRWLKRPTFGHLPACLTIDAQTYTWKYSSPVQISMYRSDDMMFPLAWLDRASCRFLNGEFVPTRAAISMRKDVEHIADYVVAACIILEHGLRISDKGRQTKIAAVGQHTSGGVVMRF